MTRLFRPYLLIETELLLIDRNHPLIPTGSGHIHSPLNGPEGIGCVAKPKQGVSKAGVKPAVAGIEHDGAPVVTGCELVLLEFHGRFSPGCEDKQVVSVQNESLTEILQSLIELTESQIGLPSAIMGIKVSRVQGQSTGEVLNSLIGLAQAGITDSASGIGLRDIGVQLDNLGEFCGSFGILTFKKQNATTHKMRIPMLWLGLDDHVHIFQSFRNPVGPDKQRGPLKTRIHMARVQFHSSIEQLQSRIRFKELSVVHELHGLIKGLGSRYFTLIGGLFFGIERLHRARGFACAG